MLDVPNAEQHSVMATKVNVIMSILLHKHHFIKITKHDRQARQGHAAQLVSIALGGINPTVLFTV